jgi:hypothetical protein
MINIMFKNPTSMIHDQLSIIGHNHMANTCNLKKLTLDIINKIILWCKELLSVSKMVPIEGYQKFFSFDVWSIMKTWSSKSTTKLYDCLEFFHVYTIIIWNTNNIPWNCKSVQTSMLNHMFWTYFWIKQKLIF